MKFKIIAILAVTILAGFLVSDVQADPPVVLSVIQKPSCDRQGTPCTLLRLNHVPDGLSGFTIDTGLEEGPRHVRIIGLPLRQVDASRISGVDLQREVEAGRRRVSLAAFEPQSANITIINLDDDNGQRINARIEHVNLMPSTLAPSHIDTVQASTIDVSEPWTPRPWLKCRHRWFDAKRHGLHEYRCFGRTYEAGTSFGEYGGVR